MAVGVAALVSLPLAVGALPARSDARSADELVAAVRRSGTVGYSGYAEAVGGLSLPLSADFSGVADLFGDRSPAAGVVARRPGLAGGHRAGHRRDRAAPGRRGTVDLGVRAGDGAAHHRPGGAAAPGRGPGAGRARPAAAVRGAARRGRAAAGPPDRRPRRARAPVAAGRPRHHGRAGRTSGWTARPGCRCGWRCTAPARPGRWWRPRTSTSARAGRRPARPGSRRRTRDGSGASSTPTWPRRSTSSRRSCRRWSWPGCRSGPGWRASAPSARTAPG